MSRPRYKWLGYIRQVLRAYPALRDELNVLQRAAQTKVEMMPEGATMVNLSDPQEQLELEAVTRANLPAEGAVQVTLADRQEQRELEAVEKVMREVDETSLKLVDMVFFKQTHTLQGAALCLHISYRTARRRQEFFIVSVAEELGLL